jgi:hypothetical protein
VTRPPMPDPMTITSQSGIGATIHPLHQTLGGSGRSKGWGSGQRSSLKQRRAEKRYADERR